MHDPIGAQILSALGLSMLVFKPKWEALFEANPRLFAICALSILVITIEASR